MADDVIGQCQIRLLELHPVSGDNQDEILNCDLRSTTLGETEAFETLSYVWGDQSLSAKITVAGQEVMITQSLHAALRRMRTASKRCLWVDQICIDQTNLEEKPQQVRVMCEIYSRCTRCLIWMGELEDGISMEDAEAAVRLLQFMADAEENGECDPSLFPVSRGDSIAQEGMMQALTTVTISGNSWWSRIWTVQEAVLPSDAMIYWGPLQIPWCTMQDAAFAWIDGVAGPLYDELTETQSEVLVAMASQMVWLYNSRFGDIPIHNTLKWRYREATDPRDKIFGILGLIPAGVLPNTESCGYSAEVAKIYISVTIDLILHHGDLRPLIIDPRLEPEHATKGIPSWAIDLSRTPTYNGDWFHLHGYDEYNACGEISLDVELLRNRVSPEFRVLELRGVYVGSISRVGEPFLSLRHGFDPLERLLATIRGWAKFLLEADASEGTFFSIDREAFARLLWGSSVRDHVQQPQRPVTDTDIADVLEFLDSGKQFPLWECVARNTRNQVIFITESGDIGLGYVDSALGDEIWVLEGVGCLSLSGNINLVTGWIMSLWAGRMSKRLCKENCSRIEVVLQRLKPSEYIR